MRLTDLVPRIAAGCAFLLPAIALAVLSDKIEVDEGDVAKPGELGVKVHLNTTPSGSSVPVFEGEIPAQHAWRFAPEITYGIAPDVEIGATLPWVHSPAGGNRSAGMRAAVKWNLVHPDGDGGLTAAIQFEYGWISSRFEQETRVLDVTPVLAWRDADWRLAFNPGLMVALAGPDKGSRPRFDPALKVARHLGGGWWIGPEYYGSLGPLGDFLPASQQSQALYLAVDLDREPWAFNFGIGRGLNAATDRWTVKAIVEMPF